MGELLMDHGYLILTYIVSIAIGIGLLLLLREVFCWYYKINAIKEIMEEQRDLLKKLVDKQTE
jgi:hypothetical protein